MSILPDATDYWSSCHLLRYWLSATLSTLFTQKLKFSISSTEGSGVFLALRHIVPLTTRTVITCPRQLVPHYLKMTDFPLDNAHTDHVCHVFFLWKRPRLFWSPNFPQLVSNADLLRWTPYDSTQNFFFWGGIQGIANIAPDNLDPILKKYSQWGCTLCSILSLPTDNSYPTWGYLG